ncbi:hypothetical protein JCM8115_005890 [Rhodotorula mucilaginosa]
MKLTPSGTAITALLALDSLSRLALVVNAAPSPSSPAAALLLVQRSDAAHRETEAVPNCAQYQGTVGSPRVSDLYLVTSQCRRRHAVQLATETRSVTYDFETLESQAQGGDSAVGPLFWLRPDDLDVEANIQVQAQTQLVLSQHSAPRSVKDLLLLLDPEFAPAHVIDLDPISAPNTGGSGALISLSPSNLTHNLAQLEYLTSHPLLAHWTLVAVPLSSTTPSLAEGSPYPEVPKFAVDRIRHHLDALAFQPTLSAIIKSLEGKKAEDRIRQDVQVLSGEDQSSLKDHEKWVSRHSMSEGGHRASDWVHAQMSSYGFDCSQLPYLTGFAPMVECVYRDSGLADDEGGDSKMRANETVVLGAHSDSRGSFGYPTAPGADDDASGTSLVLAVARQIWQHRLQFSRKLVLALFGGEEQGLLSSSYYARKMRTSGEDVLMMLQVDMVGYRKPGEPMQLARPDIIGLKEAGWFVGNVSGIYAPELVVGYTPACCSDHQSYVAQGYPATWIFERNGAIADPCYHNSCDVSRREGYSFEQIAAHTKVAFATVWELAGGRLP